MREDEIVSGAPLRSNNGAGPYHARILGVRGDIVTLEMGRAGQQRWRIFRKTRRELMISGWAPSVETGTKP